MTNNTCPSLLDTLGFLKFPEIPNIDFNNSTQYKLDQSILEINKTLQEVIPQSETQIEPQTNMLEEVSSDVLNSEAQVVDETIASEPETSEAEVSEAETSESEPETNVLNMQNGQGKLYKYNSLKKPKVSFPRRKRKVSSIKRK